MSLVQPRNSKLQVIQVLRGISALLVVLYHVREPFLDDWPKLSAAMSHGEIGVDIFFLISGIVIYISTQEQRARNAATFLVRRLFRVVIPAWAAMILMACVRPPRIIDALLGAAFIPLENGHPPGYGFSFLIVAWTLTYELIFYSIFSLALTTQIGRRHRASVTSIIILAMVATVQSLTGHLTVDATQAGLFPSSKLFPMQVLSLLGNPLFLEFVLGLVLAALYQRHIFHRLRHWRPFFGLALICLASMTVGFQYHDGDGLTNGGLLAFWIVIGALTLQSHLDTMDNNTNVYWHDIPESLGNISYSLYLTHPIIKLTFLSIGLRQMMVSSLGSLATFVLILLAALGAAHVFYRKIEVPAQRYGKTVAEAIAARSENP